MAAPVARWLLGWAAAGWVSVFGWWPSGRARAGGVVGGYVGAAAAGTGIGGADGRAEGSARVMGGRWGRGGV